MEPINRRTFLKASAQVAAAATVVSKVTGPAYGVIGANEQIRIACVGINGRGSAHIKAYLDMKSKGVDLAALCDIDDRVLASRAGAAQGLRGKKLDTVSDMRKLFENKDIDAVSFATPNHWHALGTIWACQAGKDVYVEKPASWSLWEGRKMVEAARKYNRMVQVGTQSRSSNGIRKGVAELYAGIIGDVYMARALCYKRRDSIGTRPDGEPPKNVHYDLWLGPAQDKPFNANYVHYNWHWFWDFGNGDLGNQGAHEMDKAVWGLNKKELPVKVASMGGRYGYKDQGQTPNTQVAMFTYADGKMLVFEVRGRFTNDEKGETVGNLFYGSTGFMAGWRAEMGSENKKIPGKPAPEIKDLPPVGGSGEGNHFENFIQAVRSRKVEDLNAEIINGHLAAAHIHMANIAFRLGKTLDFDPKTEQFTGDYAAEANKFLKREYRAPFVIPDQV